MQVRLDALPRPLRLWLVSQVAARRDLGLRHVPFVLSWVLWELSLHDCSVKHITVCLNDELLMRRRFHVPRLLCTVVLDDVSIRNQFASLHRVVQHLSYACLHLSANVLLRLSWISIDGVKFLVEVGHGQDCVLRGLQLHNVLALRLLLHFRSSAATIVRQDFR